jgi:hypothetical protein
MSISPNKLSFTECHNHLVNSYHDVVKKNGLIDFTKKARKDKYSIKQQHLTNLFSKTVWSDSHKKSGHRKLINCVTGVVIEYSDHDKNIDPGAVGSILEAVQNHLNIIGNNIFCYDQYNWKEEPDYKASVNRWLKISGN